MAVIAAAQRCTVTAWQPTACHAPVWDVGSCIACASCLQEFCRKNGVKLLIRSHEGPDARMKRPASDRMDGMDTGFTVDLKAEGEHCC